MNIDSIQRIIEEQCRINAGSLVVAGVSGGPDSLCMLDVLVKLGIPVIAAHFDHQLRPVSAEEARHVERITAKMGVRFVLGRDDVQHYARNHKMSIEEASRVLRYRFLFREARNHQASFVAVAHTADDQVETVLMHLLRGAGLSGLRGMAFNTIFAEWDEEIPLVRPLLATWKKEILEYCKQNALEPVFDATNASNVYFRNRLRNELIPYLQTYNPQIKKILWRTSQSLSGDMEIIQAAMLASWKEVCLQESDQVIEFSLQNLRRLSLGMMRAVFRHAIEKLRPELRDIDFDDVERAVAFTFNPPRSHRMNLLGGLWLWWEGESLFFAGSQLPDMEDTYPALKEDQPVPLTIPGRLKLGGNWILENRVLEFSSLSEVYEEMGDPYEARIDYHLVESPLTLRCWRPGDSFQPLGMKGSSVKLSDFFTNLKIPRRAREKWPLVVSGERIVWIPGLRLDNRFRVSETTQKILFLKLSRVQSADEG